MLIQQLINLIKVRIENLKLRTDLQDQVMDVCSVTQVNDYFEYCLKIFGLKIKAFPVNAGLLL